MKRIDDDIKNQSFRRFYLLYGSEKFLSKQYESRLIKAVGADEMNMTVFNEDNISEAEFLSIAETMPMFAERRLVVVRNSGWFSKSTVAPEKLENLPDTSVVVFSEDSVKENNALFKFVSKNGLCVNFKPYGENELRGMIKKTFELKGLEISSADSAYLLFKIGNDMANIQSEISKLSAYCQDKGSVTQEDIDEICHENPETTAFKIVDALMAGKRDDAFKHYEILLQAKEDPLGLLQLVNQSFSRLYNVALLDRQGANDKRIEEVSGTKDFLIKRYKNIGRRVGLDKLEEIVSTGLELERKAKRGQADKQLAFEIFMLNIHL